MSVDTRKPLPPGVLADALQGRVHQPGTVRPARSVKAIGIAHPAQPSHAQAVDAQTQLDAAIAAILVARLGFNGRPTKALRAHISRQLAGVIASLETLRLALR